MQIIEIIFVMVWGWALLLPVLKSEPKPQRKKISCNWDCYNDDEVRW